jgi:hypothetical protein
MALKEKVFADLSDDELLVEVRRLAAAERTAAAALLRSLIEVDARAPVSRSRLFVSLYLLHAGAASGAEGRYSERGFLEFRHVQPYAGVGAATVENIQLRCRAHNQHEAAMFFGGDGPQIVRETPVL